MNWPNVVLFFAIANALVLVWTTPAYMMLTLRPSLWIANLVSASKEPVEFDHDKVGLVSLWMRIILLAICNGTLLTYVLDPSIRVFRK